jgi:hypothetical protein
LSARIRALRSKDQGWQNVAEKNRTKGVSPTAVFWSPRGFSPEAYTDLLGAVGLFFIFPIEIISQSPISLETFFAKSKQFPVPEK